MLEALKKLWQILTPFEKKKAVLVLVLVVIMAVIEAAGILSIMPFLAVLSRPTVIEDHQILNYLYETFLFDHYNNFIIVLGLCSIFIIVFSSIFKIITNHALNRFAHLQRHYFSARLLEIYLYQPYFFFLQRNTAELNKNILSEVDQLLGDVMQPLMQMIAQGVVIMGITLVLIIYDPLIAIFTLIAIGIFYFLIYQAVRSKLYKIGYERHFANEERFRACQEVLSGIKDIKITNSTQQYMTRFQISSRSLSRHIAASDTLSQIPLFLVEAVGYTGLIVLAIFLIFKSNDIAHVLPILGLYGFAAYRILPAAQIIYRAIARLRFADAVLKNIYQDFSLIKENKIKPNANQKIIQLNREIRLEQVSFAYPSAPEKEVLHNFSLTIPVNTSVGIVGKSGSGKSTVMDILLGLLPVNYGKLVIDDIEIAPNNVIGWQNLIGYVPQHIYLVDASIAENIAFGVRKDQIDMSAVYRAAQAAQASTFIQELDQGYDTNIGERGILLSGGQRQRIGIARALYRDPPVLFMDEATSALDVETEQTVNEAIQNLSSKKTMVIIAHRESSVEHCNVIVEI